MRGADAALALGLLAAAGTAVCSTWERLANCLSGFGQPPDPVAASVPGLAALACGVIGAVALARKLRGRR